jgi:hypothetical protein
VTDAQRESQPQLYRIRVRGQLGQTIRSAFPALRARVDGGDTVLTGMLADQAAVYGVLAEAEALGLELIEVRRLPPDEPQEPQAPRPRGWPDDRRHRGSEQAPPVHHQSRSFPRA